MSDEISFNLFGEGGFINPTPWSHAPTLEERFQIPFYDHHTETFLKKQASDFDGGWRWFDTYDNAALCIYNPKLDRRAYFYLTHIDMVDSRLTPECLLFWAKSMVLVEHQYHVHREALLDSIRAMALQATIEITKEIRGDNDFTYLHSVR